MQTGLIGNRLQVLSRSCSVCSVPVVPLGVGSFSYEMEHFVGICFLVAMKRTFRCMKNEVACGYEAYLRHIKRGYVRFASYLREQMLHVDKANALFIIEKLFGCHFPKWAILAGSTKIQKF